MPHRRGFLKAVAGAAGSGRCRLQSLGRRGTSCRQPATGRTPAESLWAGVASRPWISTLIAPCRKRWL